jgi:hypothetical protein
MNAEENQGTLDALQRLRNDGDKLAVARNIDFTVVFPTEGAASAFALHLHGLGYSASIDQSDCVKTHPWDVRVVKSMIPSLQGIEAFENLLDHSACPLGGRNDGWGCCAIVSDEHSSTLNEEGLSA